MSKLGRVYVNQSVSFPPDLLAAAKLRARNLGLGFSTYVRKCLERDLAERRPLVFQETQEAPRLVADEAEGAAEPTAKPRRSRR